MLLDSTMKEKCRI